LELKYKEVGSMVTIEQKIILFSRLIYQLMNANFKEVLQDLESEYDKKFEDNKNYIDLQVKKIVNNAHKKRDLEVSKIQGTLKMNEKKDYMLQKEKCYEKFMDKLKTYIYEYIKSESYKDYLLRLINDIGLKYTDMSDISLYLTKEDYDKYSDLLSKELQKIGYKENDYKIAILKNSMIGGFVIEDNINKIRIDLSIKSLLDDNKEYIMKILFEALEM
jgi:V/A-type H+-transporting ATPase subunit E